MAALDGIVTLDGTVMGTEGSPIYVEGQLSGTVDGTLFEGSVSDSVTGFFNETVDGTEMFTASGTLPIDSNLEGLQTLENNTSIFAIAD